ncbi:hypothetical protein [Methanopyrus sp.]
MGSRNLKTDVTEGYQQDIEFGSWTRKWGLKLFSKLLELLREKVSGKKICVLISGGMDSAVAAKVLQLSGADVRGLHITHRWMWFTPKIEIKRISKMLGIKVDIVDITDELKRRLRGAKGRSVCKICKKIMLEVAVSRASVVATGECGMDTIAGAVLDVSRRTGIEPEFVQLPKRYFDGDDRIIVRPLIRIHESDVNRLATLLGVRVRRVGETGDLRRGRREGCPLQHLDPWVDVTDELMDEVRDVNVEALTVARRLGRRVSVKWPSFRIILEGSPEERRHVAECVWYSWVRAGRPRRYK